MTTKKEFCYGRHIRVLDRVILSMSTCVHH